ncbi:hypothetical protein D9757_001260 [Collybiopsis confluens]|uniref:Spindle pole body component n=1 Tax=Collybiopsis confluens TaxID=2823264 RepID=A0A8H5I0V5_9AGAR|nr:hypothetical protein D9757_001260 [Collybiopsis confluens]
MNPPSSSSTSSKPQRPVSSLSTKYGSSSSLPRPTSSASLRPGSRTSIRPKSRQQKLSAAKLLPLCQYVVRTELGEPAEGEEEHESKYDRLVDWAMKQLGLEGSNKAGVTIDMEVATKMIRGHIEKARIRSQDTLANALDKIMENMKEQAEAEGDLDDEIKKARLPAHIQFILALSAPPQPSTLTHASLYLHALENPPDPAKSDQLTWRKILEEDPFEGEHWVGVPGGIPLPHKRRTKTTNVKNDSSDNERGEGLLNDIEDIHTSPSLSPLNSDDLALDDTDSDSESSLREQSALFSAAQNDRSHDQPLNTSHRPVYTTYAYRKELEDLKQKQYWQAEWQMDPAVTQRQQQRGSFDIGNASTLGPTLQRVLSDSSPTNPDQHLPLELVLSVERHIQEQDAVREVLIALQGRDNILFDKDFNTTKDTPKLLHFSLASQQHLLSVIGSSCQTVQRLRRFVAAIMHYSSLTRSKPPLPTTGSSLEWMKASRTGKITRTVEAFTDAIDTEIHSLEVWCSAREEVWLRALRGVTAMTDALVVSLLGTEKAFRDRFEDSFQVILDVVVQVFGHRPSSDQQSATDKKEEWHLPTRSPSLSTALLLDTLFTTVQQHLERGDKTTADALTRVFVRTAEPVWGMVGRWMRIGFGRGQDGPALEEEFFIESNDLGLELGVLGLLDPDFWQEGYSLRVSEGGGGGGGSELSDSASSPETRTSTPAFLQHVALSVLESGKATGLLSALGIDVHSLDDDSDEVQLLKGWKWVSFRTLVNGPKVGSSSDSDSDGEADPGPGNDLFSVSVDRLSRLISDELTPYGQASGALLAKVTIDQCDFWSHLKAIEGLYLMCRGDIMSDFTDAIFAKMDSKQNWTDFHFLNTAFSDIVSASNGVNRASQMIHVPLIRLSYRDHGSATPQQKNTAQSRTVKDLDGLSLEYAVPFPLTYIFTPANLQIYNEIFVFMLQIRRAKNLLDKILVRGVATASTGNPGLKALYAMRSRLSWFINTLLNFIATHVIQVQTLTFQKGLAKDRSQSFDQMIKTHENQLSFWYHLHAMQLHSRCLLQAKTNALYRAILSVLDMSLNFGDLFSAFAGDVTIHDISSRSLVLKNHRSRRQRRRRKNVISLSPAANAYPETDSSSESEVDYHLADMDYSSVSLNASSSSTFMESGGDSAARINKMSTDLAGLIRFVRRGIETLAGGVGDASATFGVLAFSLEDWDL